MRVGRVEIKRVPVWLHPGGKVIYWELSVGSKFWRYSHKAWGRS